MTGTDRPVGGLTDRQRHVYAYVRDHITEHGYPPTLADIAATFGYSGSSSVRNHLRALEAAGLITLAGGRARGLRLTDRRLR